MRISSTEAQNNFGKYMDMAHNGEEVIVTKNGKDMIEMISRCSEDIVSESTVPYGKEQRVSYEEFLELTENSELRYELIDGEVICLASPSYRHQVAVDEIHGNFYNWFKGKPCRALTSPFDVTLKKNNDFNVVQPDIIVICDTENVNEKGRYHGVPTLAVEVLSESSRRYDMLKKLDLYMQTGIKEYWMVDPMNKMVHVYSFKDQDISDYVVYTGNQIVKSVEFEGLEVKLEDVFPY